MGLERFFARLLGKTEQAEQEVKAETVIIEQKAAEENAWFIAEFDKVMGKSWNEIVEQVTGLKNVLPHLDADARYVYERLIFLLLVKVKALEDKVDYINGVSQTDAKE